MALAHQNHFVSTVINADAMLQAMGNEFLVVSSRDYSDKKGVLPDGKVLTLQVIQDSTDYGIDKKTGQPIENNVMQNFDVTVLNRNTELKRGDRVALLDFDAEHSYYIDFNLILRFKDCKKLQSTATSGTNAPSTPSSSTGALSKGLAKSHA